MGRGEKSPNKALYDDYGSTVHIHILFNEDEKSITTVLTFEDSYDWTSEIEDTQNAEPKGD